MRFPLCVGCMRDCAMSFFICAFRLPQMIESLPGRALVESRYWSVCLSFCLDGGASSIHGELYTTNETGSVRSQGDNRLGNFVGCCWSTAGAWAANCSRPSPMASVPSVRVGPGLTALTRTPFGPYSAAQVFVKRLMAALLAP
jgi:hypothetical protein